MHMTCILNLYIFRELIHVIYRFVFHIIILNLNMKERNRKKSLSNIGIAFNMALIMLSSHKTMITPKESKSK